MTYETTRVGENSHRVITVGTGETLSNRLIDIDRPGASATIRAVGASWRIEHVGFKGRQDDPDQPALVCADNGGDRSLIDRVWLGDGGDGTALEVSHTHSGHLDVASVYVDDWGGGFHSTRPLEVAGGDVDYASCYGRDVRGAVFKVGGDRLYDCVTESTDTAGRGLWAWADTDCLECAFGAGGRHYSVHAGAASGAAEVTLEESFFDERYRGGIYTTAGSSVIGSSEGGGGIGEGYSYDYGVDYGEGWSPTPPATCPTSAIDAADGFETATTLDAWEETSTTTYVSAGTLGTVVEGLEGGREYEYRAVIENGDREVGETRSFETRQNPGREETVTVEIPPNTHHHVNVGDGETFENVIFDCTNKHTTVTITCDGGNWTLRNIAFAGDQDRPNGPCYSILARVDEGRSGTIENVWLGDGSTVGRGECGQYGRGAILAMDTHEGDLTVRETTIAWFPGEGIHTHTAPGDVTVENCYLQNNGHSYVTFGEGSNTLRNTTMVHRLSDPL